MNKTAPGETPRVCLVSGRSGSGKTTLVERLIPALAARGVPCATVKHHRDAVETDRPGKDTWRHRRAGARATFLVTEEEVTAWVDRPAALGMEHLARHCPDGVRLLLVEGFKGLRGVPRIEVVRSGVERELQCNDDVLCVATDVTGLPATCPVLSLDDADAVADLLVRSLFSSST
ncbi:MAG TPA: molybdopterin-guanine dinucleotide biosynthesis protein B [Deferrisomatales bacterium]|nr:molybdopterin-guanine dinucleotide biosynthesis protein B [Deferrisomatales bacterium]